ncbi:MAG: cyclic nucleotide-binding domain-containing protein [Polyangia bacterium]
MRAVEKRNFDRAAALYLEVAANEPDPDWNQRAGDAYRRAGQTPLAVAQLALAAAGHAKNGFLLKAIAVSKTLLQLDPAHTATQRVLADLYAKRDAKTVPAAVPAVLRQELRRDLGQPIELVDVIPKTGAVSVLAIDEALDGTVEATQAPMDVLPLHRVLGGRRSEHLSVADLTALAGDPSPGAYEIVLDEDELEIVVPDEADLPRIPLFSSLSADDLQQLIERMTLSERDGVILHQGDVGGALYVIVDGQVRVHADGRDLAVLEAGAFFGELGLLSDDPRSATVEAVGKVRVLEISRELAWDVMRRSPEVLRTLLRFFRDRMIERLLGTSPLFRSLSADDARSLSQQFMFLELDAGAQVVKQGTRAPGLFIIVAGEVEVQREGVVLGRLVPGHVFGEMSLLAHGAATADVIAIKKTWVLELPASSFHEMVMTYPQVLEYVSQLDEARRNSKDTTDGAVPATDAVAEWSLDLL